MANAKVLSALRESLENIQRDFDQYRQSSTKEFSDYKEKTDKKIKYLHLDLEHEKTKNKEYLERLCNLEKEAGVEYEDGEPHDRALDGANDAPPGEVSSRAGEAQVVPIAVDEDEVKMQKSEEARKSKPIKDVINKTILLLMGLTSLVPKHLPAYPYTIDTTSEHWPRDKSTQQPLLRINYREGPKEGSNAKNFDTILAHIKSNGKTTWPAATKELEAILDPDLEEKVWTKLGYLYKEGKKEQQKRKDAEKDDENIEDSDEDGHSGGGKDQKGKNGARAIQNSRKQSILAQRVRKRALHATYKDSKYDGAFIVNAMSDVEDDLDQSAGDVKAFVTHAPGYRSDEAQKVYDEVDAIKDPEPDKEKAMTARKKGAVDDTAVPPKAKTLTNRLRSWLIKPDVLAKNTHWKPTRVALSGAAWGEEEPEEEPAAAKGKKRKGETTTEKAVKKLKLSKDDGGSKYQERKAALSSEPEDLFND